MLYFRPENGAVGDAIPFYWRGEYHLFYLLARPVEDPRARISTSWAHAVSKDLVSWKELPRALEPAGTVGSPDESACWTGSVIEHEGTFHIFYTGGRLVETAFRQTICHATSADLVTWVKDQKNPIVEADPRWYEPHDWRDPFVYWSSEHRRFEMLIAARGLRGWSPRRGCIAVAVSSDLREWSVQAPGWEPQLTHVHECPELFTVGGRQYLAYSTYSEDNVTHYRLARRDGSYRTPGPNDSIDGRFYYAAKGLNDGRRQVTFGWIPEVTGRSDEGEIMWAGDLGIPHVLRPGRGGALHVSYPESLLSLFPRELEMRQVAGEVSAGKGRFFLRSDGGTAHVLCSRQPRVFYMRLDLAMGRNTASAGLILDADRDLDHGCFLEFETASRCLRLFKYPRGVAQRRRKIIVQRTLPFAVGSAAVEVFYENGMLTVFVNKSACLSARTYERGDLFGFFVQSGRARCLRVSVRVPDGDGGGT